MTETFQRPLRRTNPEAVTGLAGDQPGAMPILDGPPTASELPTDQSTGEPVPLIYMNATSEAVEVASPDGSGGVATGTLVDLSASISIGDGLTGGLL